MTITPKHALIAAGLVLAGVLVYFALEPSMLPPEVAIERLVDQALTGAEEGDVDAVMEVISERFSGQAGGNRMVDRQALRTFLVMYLLRGGVSIQVLAREIEILGLEKAAVHLSLIVGRGGFKGAMEGDMGARNVDLTLALEDGEWKVVSSRHEGTGGDFYY